MTKKIQHSGEGRAVVWEWISKYGAYFYAAVFLVLLVRLEGKLEVVGWFLPVLTAFVLTAILQALIKRPRPVVTKTDYRLFVKTYSFPSMHASTSFAFAAVLSSAFLQSSLAHSWVYVVVFFLLAFCIAISRIVVGVHYFFDVIVGACFGFLLAMLMLGLQ